MFRLSDSALERLVFRASGPQGDGEKTYPIVEKSRAPTWVPTTQSCVSHVTRLLVVKT